MVLGGLGVIGVIALLVFASAWSDVRHARARVVGAASTLQHVAANPATLRTPDGRIASLGAVDAAVISLKAARSELQGSFALSVAGAIPGLRGQRAGLLQLLDDSSSAVSTSRDLLARVDELARTSQMENGEVPMEGLQQLEVATRAASSGLARVARPDIRLWGELGRARRHLDDTARSGAERLSDGADAIRAARGFIGEGGDRRYFVAVQNNAEMRDQGMVLSYVIVNFSGGRLSFGDDGSVDELRLDSAAPTALAPGTAEIFGPLQPSLLWQSVNATADFPLSAQVMRDMYRQARGEEVDGVIAIDVPGLVALLRVVGPVTVPGIAEPVSAANAPRVLLHDLYAGLPPLRDDPERAGALSRVTKAVIERLTTGTRDAVALGRELGDASKGGHFRLWSAVAGEEETFEQTGLGGGPAAKTPDRTFHLAVENRTATKLDYYVKPKVRYEVQISRAGTAVVRTTVTLDNTAPVGAPPSYVLGPDQFTEKPGDYVAWVLLWGPAGSDQLQGGVTESGLNLAQRIIDVAAGQQREISFDTIIPGAVQDGVFELRLVPQPRLEPMPLDVVLAADGWKVDGDTSVTGFLDRTFTLRWAVSR